MVRRLVQGLGNCHTRSCYKNRWYRLRVFHMAVHDRDDVDEEGEAIKFPSAAAKEEAARKVPTHILPCPWCIREDTDEDDEDDNLGMLGPNGNSEHYHLYCKAQGIEEMRMTLDETVDGTCDNYCFLLRENLGYERAADRLRKLVKGRDY
jgi:hypothetical protein